MNGLNELNDNVLAFFDLGHINGQKLFLRRRTYQKLDFFFYKSLDLNHNVVPIDVIVG